MAAERNGDNLRGAASPFPSDSSTSAQTGAHIMTPDSDSDGSDPIGITGDHVYELQDRSRAQSDRGRYARREFDHASTDEGRYDIYAEEGERYGGGQDSRGGASGRSSNSSSSMTRDSRVSTSTVASFELYTPDEERAVVRKFDRRLVLFLSLCYMIAFLDRSNIGNARIAGMEEDLQTRPPRDEWYDWALSAFYIAYIGFEWMSILWRLIPAHIYVAVIVASWGIIASLQAVCTSYAGLIALRALLGIGEAAFTGVPFYLSFFFKRHELAFRTAIFISAAPLATSFASSLAWLILKVAESGPIAPWRLLFLIEGFPSVIIATIAWRVIPDSPSAATYLTAREKKVARLRMRHERPRRRKGANGKTSPAAAAGGLRSRELFSVFLDPKAWITAAMFFLANMAYSSLPVFLPTILTEMGYSRLEAQGLAAPPYLLAFAAVLMTARASDRAQQRAPFVAAHATASAVGYGFLALARPLGLSPGLRYAAVYPAAIGFFNVVVLVIAWSVNNQPSDSRRGGGFALLQFVGQCGPLIGTRLYPARHAPFFEPGMWTCAAAMLAVALLALVLRFYLGIVNRRLDAGLAGPAAEMGGGGAGGEPVDEEAQGLVSGTPSVGDGGVGPLQQNGESGFRFML